MLSKRKVNLKRVRVRLPGPLSSPAHFCPVLGLASRSLHTLKTPTLNDSAFSPLLPSLPSAPILHYVHQLGPASNDREDKRETKGPS